MRLGPQGPTAVAPVFLLIQVFYVSLRKPICDNMKRCLPFILLFISLLAVPAAGQSLQELWIANGQRNIYGEISKPRNTGRKQPVAIISHGFNGTHHYGRTYFETLNAIGYQVYVFDFPCGSAHSRSDNNTLNMSAMDEKSDVKAIVNYFREQPDVDSDGIVLIGESQGGFVTALASAEIPDTTYLWDVPLGRRFFLELRDLLFGKLYYIIRTNRCRIRYNRTY